MKPFIVVSFYTKDTPYEQEIDGLVKSCEEFKVPLYIQGYDDRGVWVKNCAIKPEFICEMLTKFPDKNIVFVDSDAKIRQYPILFDTLEADFAVHYKGGKELLSGTIYLKNCPKMQQFVRYWITAQNSRPQEWDQRTLHWCVEKYKKTLKLDIKSLPPGYTQIFDTMAKCGAPVIEHFQASRRFKIKTDSCVNRQIPDKIRELNPRVFSDGTIYLPRVTPEIEKIMCIDYCKLPKEPRWYPRCKGSIKLDDLNAYFDGKNCYVVGKGPSLDWLTPSYFSNENDPVICLNESIHKVETLGIKNKLFVLQQDAWLKNTCMPKHETTTLLLGHACEHWYADVRDKFCFHFVEIGLSKHCISVIYAIAIAKCCKATGFKLLAFDAAINKDTGYAKVIGYNPVLGGSPTRFLNHRLAILSNAKPLPLEFIPITPVASSSCTQQPL